MSDALFLGELHEPQVGATVRLTGDEARHAVAVRRIQVGESVMIADGAGLAIRGDVVSAAKSELVVEVAEVLRSPSTSRRISVAQALPKGDRAELAVTAMTELGVERVLAWQAARSIVRWSGERGAKGLAKWQAAAREATKQSRRFAVPAVRAVSTQDVVRAVEEADLALILHEGATRHIAETDLPAEGEILLIVGPEGGISPEELEAFTNAGGRPVVISDGVLRTSTAGVVALGQLEVMGRR